MRGVSKTLAPEIRALKAQGLRKAEIARRLNCSQSNVSQTLSRADDPAPRVSDAMGTERFRRPARPETCQRPDARKGFATCGEPKKVTACGERLGVCEYHWNSTMPLGGTKL